ncbi:RidA family protein [candidate division KSB1 bacterium]
MGNHKNGNQNIVIGVETGNFTKSGVSRSNRSHPVPKRAVHAPRAINEAYDYHPQPSSFSRALRVNLKDIIMIFISGTASVDEVGQSIHTGDFKAQTRRCFLNIKALLESEGLSWHDVVKTTCYLRDIERDYAEFNEVRTEFYKKEGLDPLPASVGIQAAICRSNLLVEIEALAIVEVDSK